MWYKKSQIKIYDIISHLPEILKQVSSIKKVKNLYVWGSFLKKENDKDAIIKDLDIVACADLFSEDLLSIENNEFSPLKMASSQLEENGYDPEAVNFTKEFIKITKLNIDHWAISNDKKILHWGNVIADENERKEIIKEAQDFASFEIGIKKQQLKNADKNIKQRWEVLFDHHYNKYLKEVPESWYKIDCDFQKALKSMRKI